jgi:peroxiredoxin/Cu/Ag efflux protein CusF
MRLTQVLGPHFGRIRKALTVQAPIVAGLLWLGPSLPVAAQFRPEGEGRVVAVDEVKGTLTLDHGPIPGLMSAMRMEFPVETIDLLRDLRVGDLVRFSLRARDTEWVIATMERPGPARPAMFPAPDFTLPALTGTNVRLSDLRGKAVLVNFWATWCVPCRTEMPAIEALYQRYKDRGLDVLAINLDVLSTAGVETFVKEVSVTFPIVLDPSWTVAQLYRVGGLPTTYLIDRGGNVVVREIGERNWADEVGRMAVERLLR